MATREDAWPVGTPTEPQLLADVSLIEIDQGDPPALARLAEVLYRWRYGLVVLSPLLIGVAAVYLASQRPETTETVIEADPTSSALDPRVAGVAGLTGEAAGEADGDEVGPSSRSGAASADPLMPSSTIIISPAAPTVGDTCTLEVPTSGLRLHAGPDATSTAMLTIPAGSYPVVDIVDGPDATWHFVDVDGVFGWAQAVGPTPPACR